MNKLDFDTISAIVDRALLFLPDRERRDIFMDLTATVTGGCPLRLDDMLMANDFDFVHDIVGIERHLNRRTFKLEDCFCPRFADLKTEPEKDLQG